MKISLVIPVYNSAEILPHLWSELSKYFKTRNEEYEVIFICDNSPDNSWQVLQELEQKANGQIKGYLFAKNFGQQNATLCGLAKSTGDIIITMDDDLQHHPREIPKLLDKQQEEDFDIVIGKFENKYHSRYKKFLSQCNSKLVRRTFDNNSDIVLSSFRLIRKATASEMIRFETAFPYMSALMFAVTSRIGNATVEHNERYSGSTNYSLRKTIALSSRFLINNSTILLDIVAALGIVSLIFSVLNIIYTVVAYSTGIISQTGYASVIISIYLIGGLILFSIGILGKYLSRILKETTNPPNYVIRDELGS